MILGFNYDYYVIYNTSMVVHPISFSIPEEKIVDLKQVLPNKTKLLANIVPGNLSTYVYNNEKDYYEDYQKSYFALTKKKAGWDCLRHYEILANGCIPLFDKIENIPSNTMVHFPKEILKQVYAEDLYNKFNLDIYTYFANLLHKWTVDHLTTSAMARYVLNVIGKPDVKSVLYISTGSPDYLRCLTLHGFKKLLKAECHDYPRVDHLYTDCNTNMNQLYGKGMTYAKLLDANTYRNHNHDNVIRELIATHHFDIVIYGSIHRCQHLFDLVTQHYCENEVVLFCGEDLHNDCVLDNFHAYHKFKRE